MEGKQGNYTVAFLDILGFKTLVESMPIQELAEKYERVIAQTDAMNYHTDSEMQKLSLFPSHPIGKPFCQRFIFSDSLILISDNDSAESCLKLLLYAWRLSQVLLAFQLPVRGAVTFGEMYLNPNANIFLGKALTEAAKLEAQQEWVGVAIDESIVKAFPKIAEIAKSEGNVLYDLLFPYEVPLKQNEYQKMHTLNWRWNMIAEKGTKALFPQSSSEGVKTKQEHTLNYAKAFVQTERLYIQGQAPPELSIFYIGSKEPPFSHGDDL